MWWWLFFNLSLALRGISLGLFLYWSPLSLCLYQYGSIFFGFWLFGNMVIHRPIVMSVETSWRWRNNFPQTSKKEARKRKRIIVCTRMSKQGHEHLLNIFFCKPTVHYTNATVLHLYNEDIPLILVQTWTFCEKENQRQSALL